MPNNAAFGSIGWSELRDGALTRTEQLSVARQAVAGQISLLPKRVRRRLFSRGAADSALIAGADPPDSVLARNAFELAEEVSAPALLAHSLRCWLWADLFAQLDRIAYDAELLYISAQLHDIALSDAHRPGPDERVGCFAVHGARSARGALAGWSADDVFAERVADAISLHMNVRVPVGLGVEAHLLHAAANLDVAGARAAELPDDVVREVLRMQPRDGFGMSFQQAMRREAAERPKSRAALFWRLGMRGPIRSNPLDKK